MCSRSVEVTSEDNASTTELVVGMDSVLAEAMLSSIDDMDDVLSIKMEADSAMLGDAELDSTSLTTAVVVCVTTSLSVDDGLIVLFPSSINTSANTSFAFPTAPPRKAGPGRKRVHQNATRSPRSMMRCFAMKSTTMMKNDNAASTRKRSSQSACSSAWMSCRDVRVAVESRSCCADVARSVAVDWSSKID